MNRSLLSVAACAVAIALPAFAQSAPKTHLKIGDKAPEFSLPSTTGKPISLKDYLGKSLVVVAFFPAAFTGG